MAKEAEERAGQADRIKQLRADMRVSQEAVADAIGVTTRAYQEWEAGRGGIKRAHLKALAQFFSTTQDYIEYGVLRRERGDTPQFLDSDPGVEEELANLAQKVSQLEDQIRLLRAEQAAHDAEVMRRLSALPQPSQAPPDEQQQ